jgi:hypothetical protein
MPATSFTLQVKGLGKKKAAAFIEEARRNGMTPQQYLKHLVEEDLAIAERARTTTFEELLGPGEQADEEEIDRLVEQAKARVYQGKTRKR